jgi:hypothetical protein
MGRRDERRDALGRAAEERHRGLLRADANRRARRAWGAWGGVHRDEVADAGRLLLRRELAGARWAEKLAGRGRGVRARGVKLHRARRHSATVWALCRPDGGPSAA